MTRTHSLAWLAAPLALALMGICFAPALAADQIGLFFDETGETACVQASSYSTVSVYLILLSPSAGAGVSGWECSLEFESALLLGTTLYGGGLNFDTAPDFMVGIGTASPLPAQPAVVLAQLSVMTTGNRSSFFVHPYSIPSLPDAEAPIYADGANSSILLPLAPAEIGPGGLVAGVNLPNCVPLSASWGEVKSTFE